MSKYYNTFQGFVKAFTGAAKPGVKGNPTTIIGVAPSKNIKKFQKQKEKIINTVDKYSKDIKNPEFKMKMKEGTSGTLSNISKIYKGEPITKKVKKVEKKAMGGRIGYKKGTIIEQGPPGTEGQYNKAAKDRLSTIIKNKKTLKSTNPKISQAKKDKAEKQNEFLQGGDGQNFKKPVKQYSMGGRIGRKMGGGSDMSNTNVKKKYKGFSKLPETVQIKINKKLAKKV